MNASSLARDAVLRIGEVVGVEGRRIFVQVDRNKNLSHMFLDGDIISNVGVNGHLTIAKGFIKIVGRVEGERVQEEFVPDTTASDRRPTHRTKRILTVAVAGYIDERGEFWGGTKELPLVGAEAFLLTPDQLRLVHNLVRTAGPSVSIATLYGEDIAVEFPIDGLFNSHIAIFGNTGSGKSNTLASLYQELIVELRAMNLQRFEANTRFLFLDFNGEYVGQSCVTPHKTCYNLSTRVAPADKLPMKAADFLNVEVLSILADATEKTQKQFLARALKLFQAIKGANVPVAYYRAVLQSLVKRTLQMTDKMRAFLLLD
jgi:hypothetical protein